MQKQNTKNSNLVYHISNIKCSNDIYEHTTNHKEKFDKNNDISTIVNKDKLL